MSKQFSQISLPSSSDSPNPAIPHVFFFLFLVFPLKEKKNCAPFVFFLVFLGLYFLPSLPKNRAPFGLGCEVEQAKTLQA